MSIFDYTANPNIRQAIDGLLAARALFFAGRKYVCPACGWRLRAFTRGGYSLRVRKNGYCPRCNSKARHRRVWLYLAAETNLFKERLRLLHVSPKYSLSRRFVSLPNLEYVGIDLGNRPNTKVRADLTTLPFESASFDAAICIHVLEHIQQDRQAIAELDRVLRPGGWAVISVPLRMDRMTLEDPAVTSDEEREALFGEKEHVRYYGYDFSERLQAAGFEVQADWAANLSERTREQFGLLTDENIFCCRKR